MARAPLVHGRASRGMSGRDPEGDKDAGRTPSARNEDLRMQPTSEAQRRSSIIPSRSCRIESVAEALEECASLSEAASIVGSRGRTKDVSAHYRLFSTRSRSKRRQIAAPCESLKRAQRAIAGLIEEQWIPSEFSAASLPDPLKDAAGSHIGSRSLFTFDFAGFFPSTVVSAVGKALEREFFFGSSELAQLLAEFCCLDGCLPEGAPSSPILSEVVCAPIDVRIGDLAQSHSLTAVRFLDDGSLSGARTTELVCRKAGGWWIHPQLENAVQPYLLNASKLRLMGPKQPHSWLGIRVEPGGLRVRSAFRKKNASMLRAAARYGAADAQAAYEQAWRKPGQGLCFAHVLRGRIEHIGHIHGKEDGVYLQQLCAYRHALGASHDLICRCRHRRPMDRGCPTS